MRLCLALAVCALLALSGCGSREGGSGSTPPPPPPSTNPDQRADAILAQMTQAEKLQMVHGGLTLENSVGPHNAAGWVPGISRLGVPELLYADLVTINPSTALPSALASAASWDLSEAHKYGQVIGSEMRAFGMNVCLTGDMNLTSREPRDGRTFETRGEDPLLAGMVEAAHLEGIEEQHLIAGIKHVAMNDQETARFTANAVVDERAARESDLLAFEIALKTSGAQMVMCAYNAVNGTPSCANSHLLTQTVKGDWGFPGFVLSDWYATPSSVPAALAGLDQEQPGGYMFNGVWTPESLQAALQNGDLPATRLDDMVHRILRAMFASGLFDQPATVQPIDAAGDAAIAQEMEEQGAVLLKNTGQLPLNSSALPSIAVIGSHADVGVLSGGGSAQTFPVGGAALTLPPACPPYTPPPGGAACTGASQIYDPSSPLTAIRAHAPNATVAWNDGSDPAAAAALAASSTVAVVLVSEWESEGMDRVDLSFSNNQDALVSAVAAANPHTVVVLENGGPLLMPWLSNVSAVVEAWYPGQKGGEAVANLLFGTVNPSGKLPMTFPGAVADLPRPVIPVPSPPDSTSAFAVDYTIDGLNVGYKWFESQGRVPLFPFGFGLSYTTFSISNTQLTTGTPASSGFQVSFDLQNTGAVAGAEVPQVYLALPSAAGEAKRLVGWSKVRLDPGAKQHVTINVDAGGVSHPLSIWDTTTNAWVVPGGHYTVYLGNSSAAPDLKMAGSFDL
ncbi:MAG TPA: glycoside hydrolase family 3 C-terminal domain-containing protein [Acidobacteriaceae bacterium]|nr:glycoside hydrolase family 3 C-terminal domain-containing protein [Acidobacteriaceae bacterium]